MTINIKLKRPIEYIIPITMISMLTVWFIYTLVMCYSRGTMLKLYRELGVTPWKKYDTVVSVPESELHSRDDIMAAVRATQKLYEDEWYTYNGVYLLQLSYSDELNEKKKDENDGEWIYLDAEMYTGYDSSVAKYGKGTYHTAYWAVEKQPDGSWLCRGCGKLKDSSRQAKDVS